MQVLLKSFIASFCLLIGCFTCYSQNINKITFTQLPADNQLYARDATNWATVPIAGETHDDSYDYISVVTYKNGVRTGAYGKSNLNYSAGHKARFEVNVSIKAELSEYQIEVFGVKSKRDSTSIVTRRNIVGGDFYIIYGQSNAVSWEHDYDYVNTFCRSYGFDGGKSNSWGLSNQITPKVGMWGIELQRQIAALYGIPTCVINGALPGASIEVVAGRDPYVPASPTSMYGILLHTAQNTGLLPHLKGIFYWQGETEASSEDPLSWKKGFDKLMHNFQLDYPMVPKVYLFQLPLFGGGTYDDRIGEFREIQRTLQNEYPIIQPYAPLGAPGWDGFHYRVDGSKRVGLDLALMLGSEYYGQEKEVSSPNFQKAYFTNNQHDEIAVVFEDHQEMNYPKDSTYANIEGSVEPFSTYRMADFFYINKEWQKVASGRAESNKIILKLKEPASDALIKYLPSKYHYSGLASAPWVYIGPFLSNKEGLRAFAFHHNRVAPYKDLGALSLTGVVNSDTTGIELSWNSLQSIAGYLIERKGDSKQTWVVSANQTQFVDNTTQPAQKYTYQIRGFSVENETELSNEAVLDRSTQEIILGTEIRIGDSFVYPNPVTERLYLSKEIPSLLQVRLYTLDGRLVLESNNHAPIDLSHLKTGKYLLHLITNEGVFTHPILKQ